MTDTRSDILTFAQNRDSFRVADVYAFLNQSIEISKVTLSWYLSGMVKDGILHKLGRGIYTDKSVSQVEYTPRLRDKAVKIGKEVAKNYPFINVSVLDGQIFCDFQHHLSTNNIIYVEVDRDVTESIFHFLKETESRVYHNPDESFVYDNIDLAKSGIIVKPLVTESPLEDYKGVKTPRLEKILVDILCDDDMGYLHGAEWSYMFRNALSQYSVNRTTMLRYASRRNVREVIQAAIDTLENYD